MAVSLYFGLPGCGKTTFLTYLALKGVKSRRYLNVYSNVALNIPGITYIDNDCIGKYELRDCLLLIDEATLFADSRAYKSFDKGKLEYFLEHRHRNADIVLFTQQWDGVDRKIRVITDRVYYVYKGKILGHWISSCYRIPYGILFPDKKRGGDKLGEIVQGYSKPPFFVRMFATRIFRPRYYKYFDSWELTPLPDLPKAYKKVARSYNDSDWFIQWLYKTIILLRSTGRRKNRGGFAPLNAYARIARKNTAFVSFGSLLPPLGLFNQQKRTECRSHDILTKTSCFRKTFFTFSFFLTTIDTESSNNF